MEPGKQFKNDPKNIYESLLQGFSSVNFPNIASCLSGLFDENLPSWDSPSWNSQTRERSRIASEIERYQREQSFARVISRVG